MILENHHDKSDPSYLFKACSSRDAATRELKDIQSKIQKERELFKSQEKEYVERIEKEKQQIEKLTSDLTSTREDLERANKRISELQKDFTDKQKEFTDKLNQYLQGNLIFFIGLPSG